MNNSSSKESSNSNGTQFGYNDNKPVTRDATVSNGEASVSDIKLDVANGASSNGRNLHLSAPVVIDLTQSSDEDSDVEDLFSGSESADSDLEIISHRSRSPLTISLAATERNVAATSAGGSSSSHNERSSSLSRPSAPTPNESQISVIQSRPSRPQYIFPFPPVNSSFARNVVETTGNMPSASLSNRTFHRPREDVVDWLNEIEPFNPISTVSSGNCSGAAHSSSNFICGDAIARRQQVHCGNCGYSMPLDQNRHSVSNSHNQPSTSSRNPVDQFPPLRTAQERVRHAYRRHDYSNHNQSVLERMLSTPPLPVLDPVLDEQHPHTSSVVGALTPTTDTSAAASPLSRYQSQLQQLALNLSIPPPAHTGISASIASSDYARLIRNDVPMMSSSANNHTADARANVIPMMAHGSATSVYQGAMLPSLRPDFGQLFATANQLQLQQNYSHQHVPVHQLQNGEQVFGQSQRTSYRTFNHQHNSQLPLPFVLNPSPVEFLPASVLLQGFYPDFPGFGLSSTQIERHTVKYVLEKTQESLGDEGTTAKKPKAAYADENEATCSVCLDGFDGGQTLRRLTCQHLFHADCVDEWLRRRPTCPNCRVDVRRVNNGNGGGESSSTAHFSTGFDHRYQHAQRSHRLWPFTSGTN